MGWGTGGGAWKKPGSESGRGSGGGSGAGGGGMGPYGRPAEKGMPPEPPLWHGHAWQPEGVTYDPASGTFSDGYVPGPGDKPRF